ncbi:hypothetical protein VD0004_g6675 [Verticillium dahliae]|nr:hypothetical protein VD0004_g6675 [Verticillium dahliae]
MASSSRGGHLQRRDASPPSAPTTAEFNLDNDLDLDLDLDLESEDDDLRHGESALGEAYELQPVKAGGRRDDDEEDEEDSDGWIRPATSASGRRSSMTSTVASFQLYTPDEEAAVVKKFDRRLVLFVALLYMLSFLDRSNIGNARIAGMDADLQTTPAWDGWYPWALTTFYMTYIAFEWMSILWRHLPAHAYIAAIVFSWGLIASLQAVAVSYPMLIALRALLGIGEAAFTGIPYYLSFFFKRKELALRTAVFLSAAPLATAFASSLAFLIVSLAKNGPIAPWRLLFLLEGFPSVLIAPIAWRLIPDSPQTATYLTPRQRKVARLRLRNEETPPSPSSAADAASTSPPTSSTLSQYAAILTDPLAWLPAAIFFLTNMAFSSLPVFLPKILTEMGHPDTEAHILAAPPYLVAFLVLLPTAALSDRLRSRSAPLALHALASAAGYAVLALARPLGLSPWLRYAALFPAAAGFYAVAALLLAWSVNNQPRGPRRAAAFALLQLVGQCGPLVGTRLYPDADAPFYEKGMRACAGAMLGVAVLVGVMRVYMQVLNRRMDREEGRVQETGISEVDDVGAEEEEGLVGRSSKRRREERESFRYML